MPRQTSMQLTPAQERQLKALRVAGYGSTSDIIRIAIDRMYNKEIKMTRRLRLSNPATGKICNGNFVATETDRENTDLLFGFFDCPELEQPIAVIHYEDTDITYVPADWIGPQPQTIAQANDYKWTWDGMAVTPIVRSNRNLTDNAWVRRIDELRQCVADQYDPALATPDQFVSWLLSETSDFDHDDIKVLRTEAQRLAERHTKWLAEQAAE